MADKEKKSTMKGFATNDQADYYSGITSITVNEKNAYELKGKFLDDWHNNAFSGELWDYWKLGNNEAELKNEKTFNLEETKQDDEQEIGEIFRIETNLFDYETPLCEKFKEFNYLLKIDPDVFTNDIVGFKTYGEYKDDWIYEWNKNVPWAIMEGLINEDVESNNEGWKSWDDFERTHGDRNEREWENEHEDDERYELCGNETHEFPVCNIRRFEMIKYLFRQNEEYVAVKENEYEDLISTRKNACRAYQEIFRMMDEEWMEDVWRGDGALKSLYPRVYALKTCKNVTVVVKMSHENVGYFLRRIPREGIEPVQFLE
uniref:Uncharacterized protein n=1 Tax=Tanacetum cinerariifolium TaxID=118510 RepID=A0A6L2J059_TANCI|nr:hypothetical protein [Tanacetum cinerariifolium]